MMNFSWLPPIVAQASERLVGNLSDLPEARRSGWR